MRQVIPPPPLLAPLATGGIDIMGRQPTTRPAAAPTSGWRFILVPSPHFCWGCRPPPWGGLILHTSFLLTPRACVQTYAQKGQQAQRLCNNQLKHQQQMPRGFCGRSPHFRRLLPGDGEYSSTYRMFNLSVVVCAAGAAPTHHNSIIMAM